MIQIIPEKVRDLQISLKDEKDDHAKTRVRLEDCSEQLKELIIESNEKVGELNRDLETIPYENKLSDPAELEELSKWKAWGEKLEAENMNLMKKNIDLRKAIDTLIEESQKEG